MPWNKLFKNEINRMRRQQFQTHGEGAWTRTFRLEVKNLEGKLKYHLIKKGKSKRIILKSWNELYRTSVISIRNQQRCSKEVQLPGFFENNWENLFSLEINKITSWYRNRGLKIELKKFKYDDESYIWRKFYSYWGRRIGDQINRRDGNDGWNRFIYKSIHYLRSSLGQRQGKSRKVRQIFNSWPSAIKVYWGILVQKHKRFHLQCGPWDIFCNKSYSYLVNQSLKRRNE